MHNFPNYKGRRRFVVDTFSCLVKAKAAVGTVRDKWFFLFTSEVKHFLNMVVEQLSCFWGYHLWLCLVYCLPICSLYELFGFTLLSSQTRQEETRHGLRLELGHRKGIYPQVLLCAGSCFASQGWVQVSFYVICFQQISEEFARFETFRPVSLCKYFPWAMIRAFSRVPSASSVVWV